VRISVRLTCIQISSIHRLRGRSLADTGTRIYMVVSTPLPETLEQTAKVATSAIYCEVLLTISSPLWRCLAILDYDSPYLAESGMSLGTARSSSPSKRNWKPFLSNLKTTGRLEIDGRSYVRRKGSLYLKSSANSRNLSSESFHPRQRKAT